MELHYDEDYADLDELHKRDALIKMLRNIEGESKLGMIKLMAQTKHNSRYNNNLLPTYLTIREKYDKYVKEQQVTIEHLEKIITHLDNILIDFMKKRGHNGKGKSKGNNKMNKESCSKDVDNFIANILKEKQKVSKMLIKMRNVLNKLTAIDSHVDIGPASLNSLRVSDIEQGEDDEHEYLDNDNDDNDDGDELGDDDYTGINNILVDNAEHDDEDEDEDDDVEDDDVEDDDVEDDDVEDDDVEDVLEDELEDEDDEDEDDEVEDEDEDEKKGKDDILYYIGDYNNNGEQPEVGIGNEDN
jgi:hypothetical protein